MSPAESTGMFVPSFGIARAERPRRACSRWLIPSRPPLPKRLSVMPARSIRPNGSVKSGRAGAPLIGPEAEHRPLAAPGRHERHVFGDLREVGLLAVRAAAAC